MKNLQQIDNSTQKVLLVISLLMQKLNLQFFSQNIFKELVKELTDYRRNSVKFFVCMITISLYK